MGRKLVATAQFARAAVLVDKCLAYPAPATFRGDRCPPHPFGQTLTASVPVPDPDLPIPPAPAPDNRPLVYLVTTATENEVPACTNLTGPERAELQGILAAGNPHAAARVAK